MQEGTLGRRQLQQIDLGKNGRDEWRGGADHIPKEEPKDSGNNRVQKLRKRHTQVGRHWTAFLYVK